MAGPSNMRLRHYANFLKLGHYPTLAPLAGTAGSRPNISELLSQDEGDGASEGRFPLRRVESRRVAAYIVVERRDLIEDVVDDYAGRYVLEIVLCGSLSGVISKHKVNGGERRDNVRIVREVYENRSRRR